VNGATNARHGCSKNDSAPFPRLAETLLGHELRGESHQYVLAAAIRRSETWVSRMLHPRPGDYPPHLPASCLPDIVRALGPEGGERFLRELVGFCGYDVSPQHPAEDGTIIVGALELHATIGAFDGALARAAADGSIDACEAQSLLDELASVAVKVESIRVTLRRVVNDRRPVHLAESRR
jgi:hypothetical protein